MRRIYIPEVLFYRQSKEDIKLYGRREEIRGSLIYYIIYSGTKDTPEPLDLDYIGDVNTKRSIKENDSHKIQFKFDLKLNHLVVEQDVLNEDHVSCQLILYNPKKFSQMSDTPVPEAYSNPEIIELAHLISSNHQRSPLDYWSSKVLDKSVCYAGKILSYLAFLLVPLNWSFKRTAVAQHFEDWKIVFKAGGSRNSIKKLLPIIIDVLLGLGIMLLISQKTNPGNYVLKLTHEIIVYLRQLLEGLRGNPVGLKVNVQLNDFLLNCFIYHINLWKTFLNIVSPAINYLFAILSIFGLCGFSFQVAMLSDLLVLITIHAHCFYIYAAVLYRLEIIGLKALWRIVLGRRKNILKNRMESYDYKHSQLFLATLFFSSLLFLLPTVLVYYVVFSTVRLGIYCIIYTLLLIRRKILQLPVYDVIRSIAGNHISQANIIMDILESSTEAGDQTPKSAAASNVTIVRMLPQKAPISWCNGIKGDFKNDYPSIGQFIGDLIKGEIKGFIRPRADEI